jgi:hypothetical protein
MVHPPLYSAVSRAGKKRMLKDALLNNRWARDIAGAPTTQVLCDYLRVWRLLHSVTLSPLQPDRFVWKWSSSGSYSVSSTYRALFAGSTSLLGARELWSTKAPPKVKLFFWLALYRCIWTSERRSRHGYLRAMRSGAGNCEPSLHRVRYSYRGLVQPLGAD